MDTNNKQPKSIITAQIDEGYLNTDNKYNLDSWILYRALGLIFIMGLKDENHLITKDTLSLLFTGLYNPSLNNSWTNIVGLI